jgi:D-glycero-D-manno-heptose 1,7-bisphosphate phosphatase
VNRAIFLDKDGTLVDDVPYNVDPDLVRLTPGAGRALRLLVEGGYRLVVVSNQSGVARGLFEESALEAVEQRLRSLLRDEGVSIDGFEWCPHLVGGSVGRYAVACDCRKPAPGLLVRAAGRLGIDLRRSWIVGDILDDVEAGHAAGCRAILVDVGSETRWELTPTRTPDAIVTSLEDAARAIVGVDDRAVGAGASR